MSDIPKHLLDLATDAAHAAHCGCVQTDYRSTHDLIDYPELASAALEPVLAELRREVGMRRDVHDPRSDEYWAFQEVLKVLGVRDGR